MTATREELVSELKVGDTVLVELCFTGQEYNTQNGIIKHAFPREEGADSTCFIVEFETAGLVLGHIFVSDSENANVIMFNPSDTDGCNEDLLVALQINIGALIDEAWAGALLRVCAVNGMAA